jgi:hypothetical protein
LADTATARAGNLLACGTSVWPALPCWLPHDNHVRLVRETASIEALAADAGRVRRLLERDAVSPHLVIRDASIDQSQHVWLLWEVARPADSTASFDGSGAISRHAPDGHLVKAAVLREGARLILGALPSSCYLLRNDGAIARVVDQ